MRARCSAALAIHFAVTYSLASDVFFNEMSGAGDSLKMRDEAFAGATDDTAFFVEGRTESGAKPVVLVDESE